MTLLPEIWFGLIAFLFIGYAILDGFDLGVGIIHLLGRDETERRIRLNAIGPVWDGNEVWLVATGGALFAAFPEAYATIFSGFYGALMMLLAALILRAVSLEFRGKLKAPSWRRAWDALFAAGSLVAALLIGTAVGNLLQGIPLTAEKEYLGGLPGLLNPFGLFTGLTAVLVFAAHGAFYLAGKTESRHRASILGIVRFTVLPAVLSSLVMVFWSLLFEHVVGRTVAPMALAVIAAGVMLVLAVFRPRFSDRSAFLFSSAFIASIGLYVAVAIFPALVVAAPPGASLTIRQAASSPATLWNMFVIAAIGMPLVFGYTWHVYRIFRGAVRLDGASY